MSDNAKKASVTAAWSIELLCDCPSCGEFIDVMETPDFWDGRDLDIGESITERANCQPVACPECGHEFDVCCEF